MDILWRIAIRDDTKDKNVVSFSGKFGDDIQTNEQIHARMEEISNMGIELKGIHFHCGSGYHGSSGFSKAVQLARKCMQIGRQYNHKMTILDIGGGFPSTQLSEKTLQALKPTENDPLGYTVIAEPGRHFCGNSFYLLTRVIGKKIKSGKSCFHVNESLYHSFNCNIMDNASLQSQQNNFYCMIDSIKRQAHSVFETENSTLFGMTCDGMDIIAKNIQLPVGLSVGDWLCISGMGAYTFGPRSTFNGMKSTEAILKKELQLENPVQHVPNQHIPQITLTVS